MQTLPPQRLAAALLLATIAGCVDAVGFSELGGHFVSFMSGNSTRLGLHLADHEWRSAIFTLGLVALFVGGAAAGALIVERAGRAASAVILLGEAALLAGGAVLIDGPNPLLGAVLLPPAMGLANTFLPGAGHAPIGVTYMTGALVRIGTGLAALGREAGRAHGVLLDLSLWLALVAGVTLGGIGRLRYDGNVLFAPVAALVALGLAEAWFAVRRRT
ncbi:MAG TPA: YoaK family protein [Sphingomonas sp.]